jgi:hypothetical protein
MMMAASRVRHRVSPGIATSERRGYSGAKANGLGGPGGNQLKAAPKDGSK